MDPSAIPDDLAAVRATAQAMNCACLRACNEEESLQCLYRKTLDALAHESGAHQACIHLVKPLGMVLAYQKTRAGQRDCATFAETLAAGDSAGALAACHRMMERLDKSRGA